MPVTIHEQILCVQRELKLRVQVYSKMIERDPRKRVECEYEYRCMQAVLATLKQHAPEQPQLFSATDPTY